jgi:hypothetical protein
MQVAPFCPVGDFTFLGSEGFHIFQALYHVYLHIWLGAFMHINRWSSLFFWYYSMKDFFSPRLLSWSLLPAYLQLQHALTAFSTATASLTVSPSPSESVLATAVSCGKYGRVAHLPENSVLIPTILDTRYIAIVILLISASRRFTPLR